MLSAITADVVSLVVGEAARGKGIGARLMEAVRDHAARQGVDTLKVAVMAGNSRARRFYENAGFEAGEEVLYQKF
jgi:L-amino acid N-acyltransferase